VFKDKIIIGNGGADFGTRGYVTAYDAATGRQVWRFYAAPGTPEDEQARSCYGVALVLLTGVPGAA